jgi:hypothetical protein
MIVARGGGKDGTDVVLMVLEPGNIAKMQIGQPIVKSLNEFLPELPIKVDLNKGAAMTERTRWLDAWKWFVIALAVLALVVW